MKHEVIISKMLVYIEKILKYSNGMSYEELRDNLKKLR